MQPDLATLNQFDSVIPSDTHFGEDENRNAKPQEIIALLDSRGTKDQQTDLFWITYVTTGFEGPSSRDGDPALDTYSLGQSFRYDVGGHCASIIYAEAIRDEFAVGFVPNEAVSRARVTAHEIGHQFLTGLGMPNGEHRNNFSNIMHAGTDVLDSLYYFHVQEVRALRSEWRSPADRIR
jgi:hypothetical protein